ncbi:hypothetical protein AB4162_06705 [Vibrio sp. 10N.286.52.B1]|uniref:hypothetical protein n=1 Tax=Vibrio sp. 10N.286.52.B1 TaxID=3229712 RepID=UPI003551A118
MQKIIVTDLDGTLINKNSFPMWVFNLLKCSFFSFNLKIFLKVVFLLIKRKLNIISHKDFKFELMTLKYPLEYDEKFSLILKKHINRDVENLIKENSAIIIVSTAAPINYVRFFVKVLDLNVDQLHSSYIDEFGLLFENLSENKVASFSKSFPNCDCDIFFTDHYEDEPMINFSKKTFLIKPNDKTKEILSRNSSDIVIL